MKYLKTYELFGFFKKKKQSISDDEWITITEELFYELTDLGFTVELFTPESNILHQYAPLNLHQSYWITIKKEVKTSIYDGFDDFELSEVLPTIEHTLGYLSDYGFKLKNIFFEEDKIDAFFKSDYGHKGASMSSKIVKHKYKNTSMMNPGAKTYGVQIELKKK